MRKLNAEITSKEQSCSGSHFVWRPLIKRLRESFWSITDAPYILLGLDPNKCEGHRNAPQGWHIAWLTEHPVGRYASFDTYSLEMNLEHDLSELKATLKVGGPEGFSPDRWIKWADLRGFSPPWAFAIEYIRRSRISAASNNDEAGIASAQSERHVRAGHARYARTHFPEKKLKIWEELENSKDLSKHGRKTEFDRKMAEEFGVEVRLVGNWRREWQENAE